jgi:cysteine-rich CPCC protein
MGMFYLPSIETTDGMRYQRPCCGYFAIELPPGHWDICPVSFWQDDAVQNEDPCCAGGANHPSLEEARRNYQSPSRSKMAV